MCYRLYQLLLAAYTSPEILLTVIRARACSPNGARVRAPPTIYFRPLIDAFFVAIYTALNEGEKSWAEAVILSLVLDEELDGCARNIYGTAREK